MLDISGTTRIFPVIGWPVEQVKAPALFNAYFQRHDIDARVIPLKIAPDQYVSAVRTLMSIENIGGIFVSIPFKPLTLESVDRASPRATIAGACNAVYRTPDGTVAGDLIDGEGFIRALARTAANKPIDWPNASALVIGCGGVGKAIIAALAAQGIGKITMFDTHEASATDILQRAQAAFPATQFAIGTPHADGYQLIVNASTLGMHPDDPLPVPLDGIDPACIVADCGMKIENSKLLVTASALGCRTQKGKEMLIEQAPLYLSLFGYGDVDSADFRQLGAL
jgi:shikimate dehydrogenase